MIPVIDYEEMCRAFRAYKDGQPTGAPDAPFDAFVAGARWFRMAAGTELHGVGNSDWRSPTEAPDVKRGCSRQFIVAVRREGGRVYSFEASYLNAMALVFDDDRPIEADGEDEGMSLTTGWHEVKEHDCYDTAYYPLDLNHGKDELLGWMPFPEFPSQVNSGDEHGTEVL